MLYYPPASDKPDYMKDSARYQEARRWVDSLAGKWRLQAVTLRSRVDRKTGAQTVLPARVRRFVEGCPWALVGDAVRYLLSKAPYTGVVCNGVPFDGTYVPSVTTWRRDDGTDTVSATSDRRVDGTYTLVQDLVEHDEADKYSVGSSVSCSETVVTEWHWDEGSVESLPATSEQGVTYAVQAVSRNEDGTFNYAVVERRARTVGGAWGVQRETPVAKVEFAEWDNVYGEPGSFEGLPKAGVDGNVETTLEWSRNDDCTYRVRATRTTRSAVETDAACRRDVLKHEHVAGVSGQVAPLGEAPEAKDGLVVRHDSRLRDDGTYENRVTREQETEADNGPQGSADMLQSTSVRSVRNAKSVPSVPAIGSVRSTVTPGGLFDYTEEAVTPLKGCAKGGDSDRLHTSKTEVTKNLGKQTVSVTCASGIGSARSTPTAYGFDNTVEEVNVKAGTHFTVTVSSDCYDAVAVGFMNYDGSGLDSLLSSSLSSAMSGWVKSSQDEIVPSISARLSVSLNQYGLFDGTCVAQCERSPIAVYNKNGIVASATWSTVSYTYSPIMGEGHVLAGTMMSRRRGTCRLSVGFGADQFRNAVGGGYAPGTGGSYNPYTGGWSAMAVSLGDPRFSFEPA